MAEADFSFIDGEGMDTDLAYRLIVGCVAPRPVAWITSVDAQGRVNAAPFSSYNYVATSPPMLAINIAQRAGRTGQFKDTARNIEATGQFVVNVATESNMDLMHRSAQEFPPEVSEAEVLGLELLPSRRVRPPRLAIAPVQMECELRHRLPLGRGINTLYIGEVVAFHLSNEIYDGSRVDSVKMRPVSRLGGPYYAGLGEIFHKPMLQRPPGGEGWSGADAQNESSKQASKTGDKA